MTLLFDKPRAIESPALAPEQFGDGTGSRAADGRIIEIGLVNNMPDAALKSTEQQFARLLQAAAGNHTVRLHCFALPSVPRSDAALSRIGAFYSDIDDLPRSRIDGLIVTGAEPRAASLRDEPYWQALCELIDWADGNTTSTIWSCLAAHAAVLHLDGVERHRLPVKCSGIYTCAAQQPHWLLKGATSPLQVAHSRLNGLLPADLSANGYDVVTMSDDIGVDIFTKRLRSEFIFFQGHPEYDVTSLQREYLRDVTRYLNGEQPHYPSIPANYFDPASEARLCVFRSQAQATLAPELIAERPPLALRADIAAGQARTAETIIRNWIGYLADPHQHD